MIVSTLLHGNQPAAQEITVLHTVTLRADSGKLQDLTISFMVAGLKQELRINGDCLTRIAGMFPERKDWPEIPG